MDNYGLLILLLATLGLGILICEVFIPSGGILTGMAILCFAGSTFCAWRGWYQPGHTGWWWGYVVSMLVLMPAAVSGAVWLLPRTAYGQRILAMPPSLDEVTPFHEEEERLSSLINKHGHTTTMFSPGGMVQIDTEKFHAESEGVLIDSGTDVIVVGVRANRLVVRPAEMHASMNQTPASTEPPADVSAPSGNSSSDEAVDFDFPETV